jgi:short-subunit dehydrogenase
MNLSGSRILLTGASGGIGRCLAFQFALRGARLALTGRNECALAALAGALSRAGGDATALPFDLAHPTGHAGLVERALDALGGLDILVNNAGQSYFGPFAAGHDDTIHQMMAVNIMAPVLLSRAAVPHLLARGSGCIVNVGSVLGAIGFPYFTAYSTCKFALRGFSEALRRELAGTGVSVLYAAPRTTATDMNGPAVRALMAETGATFDPPESVARGIAEAIESGREELTFGMPEKLFVLLNALLPGIVDRALRGQARAASRHLEPAKPQAGR